MVARIKTEKVPGTVTVNGGLDVVIVEAVGVRWILLLLDFLCAHSSSFDVV